MARARNIKPSLFKNEVLGVADPLLTLLFVSLWCLADKRGRLEDRPLRIKAETFPYRENMDINGYLTELSRLGFIQRYKVDNVAVIQIVNFEKHQNPHHTEKESELPEYSIKSDGCDLTVNEPLNNGYAPADSLLLIPDSPKLIPDNGLPKTDSKKQTGKKATAFDPLKLDLPQGLNFSDWEKWVNFRNDIKKPIRETTAKEQLAFISDCIAKGQNSAEIISASVRNGWQGLFEEKNKAQGFKTKSEQIAENNRRAGEAFLSSFDDFNGHTVEGEVVNG